MNFQPVDAVILALYLSLSVYVGLRARKYVENIAGYYVAGRRVGVALGSATLLATEIGIVTFMYMGEFGYVTGFAGFFVGIVGMLAYLVIGRTGFIVAAMRRLRIMTIPEFYEIRYGKPVRLIGGLVLFFGGVLNMGIFLKFDGIFLTEAIGLPNELLVVVMVVMLVAVVAYTILGGMFSVVVTDYMQFVVLTLGMAVATIGVLTHVSFPELADAVLQRFGQAGVDPLVHPRFGVTFILWMIISSLVTSALWQPITSKSLASESPRTGRRVFIFTGLTLAGRYMIPMFWGAAALVIVGPDLTPSLAMLRVLGMVVPSGFLGLMIAGMLAASMSTYSAYMLAWSSVATRDILGTAVKGGLSDRTSMILTRMITTAIGIFLLVFGLWYEIPETAFQYIALTGAMYSAGAFGCVAGGIYWKKANTVGAYASLVLGAAAPLAFLLLAGSRDSLPGWAQVITDVNVSGFLSFFLAAFGMIAGSLLTQRSSPPRALQYPEDPA